ncbi:MAG: hypothetical protein GY940_24945 [bacterium]|nr:hypothetical protein [bacterium]
MKNYRFSIIFCIVLGVANLFHSRVERAVTAITGRNFALYIIYALFLAFFLVVLFKVVATKKNTDIAIILLTMGLIFFFLFTHPVFLFKLTLLELFFFGVLVVWEGKKSKSLTAFLLIAAAAVLVELASSYSFGGYFYYLDAWRNALTGLSGYLAGSLLN